MKHILLFLFILMFKTSFAQVSNGKLQTFPTKDSIYAKSLIGFWQSTDSLKSKIEFVESNIQVSLIIQNEGVYYFPKGNFGAVKGDPNKVYYSGTFPAWPPLSAALYLHDAENLEITFWSTFTPSYSVKYRKVE